MTGWQVAFTAACPTVARLRPICHLVEHAVVTHPAGFDVSVFRAHMASVSR
jgi:hypothetical protein